MIKNVFSTILRREESTYDVQSFNLVQMIYLFGMIFMSGVIYVCISDSFYLYLSLIMIFLLSVAMIDVNRTGMVKKCVCIISIVSNFLYLPICFYGFGKLICCVPIYFILGILYTVLLLNGRLGAILSIVETVYLCLVIIYVGDRLPNFFTTPPTTIDYIAIVIAMIIVATLSSTAIKAKGTRYNVEFEHLQEAHSMVTEAYNSKDIFFANTSHEIRTPLNAIVGAVNLLLDEDLNPQTKDYVYNILNSCNALLSITDELMELSNTESNEVKLTDSKFDFSEMILEVVNMMSVRLMESAVTLYVEINTNVPKYLYGDKLKVRQLLINILNNAVKYTKEGKITLRIESDHNEAGTKIIKVAVSDTGIGIKADVLPKVFEDYKRDEEDNEKRGIEGTGLGLSLCKDIIDKMGGKIYAESEYHVGSTFYFEIPQKVEFSDPIACVSDKKDTAAIIYERNEELANSLKDAMASLYVASVIVSDRMEFESRVLSGRFNYIFIALERYMENKRFIDRNLDSHRMVIISDISQGVHVEQNCYLLTRPVNIINVAMSYRNESSTFSREVIQSGGFICPDTTILVVDDNLTNLEVASGLLKKYEANIVTAISGYGCLKTFNTTHVDIVFLDYMMPEMNGIDTFIEMRKLDNENAQNVPVVALTANVISGAKEMFLDAGFCEYITKPIDVAKLEAVLKKNLPREQLRIKI